MTRRSLLVALALAALSLAPASAAAQVIPDTTGILTTWTIEPQSPCSTDSVFLVVRGFVSTPCMWFLGAGGGDPNNPTHVQILVREYSNVRCFAAPNQFYRVPVKLGVFPPGTHALDIAITTQYVENDSTSAREETVHYLDHFVVDSLCHEPPPPPPPTPLPYVDRIETDPPVPCAGRATSLILKGHFPDACSQVIDAETINSENVHLTVKIGALPDT